MINAVIFYNGYFHKECYFTIGNPGFYLTDTGSVYISRDGGLTWEQVCTYVCSYVLM